MPPVREWHDTVQGTAMERLEAEDSEFFARSDPTVTPLSSSPSHSSAASPHSQASITPFRRSRGAHRAPAEPMGVDRTNLHPRVGGAAPQARLSRTAPATVPGRMKTNQKRFRRLYREERLHMRRRGDRQRYWASAAPVSSLARTLPTGGSKWSARHSIVVSRTPCSQ